VTTVAIWDIRRQLLRGFLFQQLLAPGGRDPPSSAAFRADLLPEWQPARNIAFALTDRAFSEWSVLTCWALVDRPAHDPPILGVFHGLPQRGDVDYSARVKCVRFRTLPSIATTCAMLVYLFRQRRNGDFALTTDLTGRNPPSHPPDDHWVFVEVIDTEKTRPPWGIADLKEAFSRVRDLGYEIF
jgi:hypothetical protein